MEVHGSVEKDHPPPSGGPHAARQTGLQVLMTFDFWADDAARLRPVWNDVLHSLELSVPLQDPSKGPVLM
jgi:hypothetical protein